MKVIDLEVVPGVRVGPLTFDMTPEEVHVAIDAEPDDSETDPDSGKTLEYYETDPELIVSFSAAGRLDAIAVEGNAGLVWAGIRLLEIPADDLRARLAARQLATEPTSSGFRCEEIGLSITSAELIRGVPHPRVTACSVYRPGEWHAVRLPTRG
jgi:hypothetical protein